MKKKQLILMVDDEQRNLRILNESIGPSYHTVSATSGEEAMRVLEQEIPDIVLLDVMMPGIDGYATCRKIREIERFALTKIIFISGKAMPGERLKGYEVGGDDYVTKPFNPEEIKAKIDVFLKLVATERELNLLNRLLEEKVHIRTEQLTQRERAAFIGIHAAEIVHNLNNPISILSGNLAALAQLYPGEKNITRAQNAIERINGTIKSILDANRVNGDQAKTSVDLNEVLLSELKLLEIDEFFKYKIKLEQNLNSIPVVRGDSSHFKQAFGNLIKNSVESMYDRKEKILRISTHQDGDFVFVEIEDSGCGISPDHLEKIYDPFFTTKPAVSKSGEPIGTGLGLTSVKRMLESYGAEIQIHSKLEVGTKFKIRLPTGFRKESSSAAMSKKDIKILCVDDEVDVLENYRRIISSLGFAPILSNSPTEAIQIVKNQGNSIGLIVSDYQMPEMSGFEFRKAILDRWKNIPFVMVSGFVSREMALEGLEHRISAFLSKPYREDQFVAMIEKESKDRVESLIEGTAVSAHLYHLS